jgi:Tol biopolymer transport system component
MEVARDIPTRVTFSGGTNPVWSPDGQRIAYQKGSPPNLFAGSAIGTGSEERLIESRDTLVLRDWSPDGKFLLYSTLSNDISSRAQPDLWLLPLTGDRTPFRFLTTPFREGAGQFSPDAEWIAYTSDESRRNEVYVQSFPSGQFKWPVSSNGGAWPRWRRDGRELFYVGLDGKVMSVEVRPVSGSLEFGTPTSLFTLPLTRGENDPYPYDVMPDGQRFLALVPASEAEEPPITVIFNWQEEQKQRVTVK